MHAVNCMCVKINVKHVFGRRKFCCCFLPHNDKYSASACDSIRYYCTCRDACVIELPLSVNLNRELVSHRRHCV